MFGSVLGNSLLNALLSTSLIDLGNRSIGLLGVMCGGILFGLEASEKYIHIIIIESHESLRLTKCSIKPELPESPCREQTPPGLG